MDYALRSTTLLVSVLSSFAWAGCNSDPVIPDAPVGDASTDAARMDGGSPDADLRDTPTPLDTPSDTGSDSGGIDGSTDAPSPGDVGTDASTACSGVTYPVSYRPTDAERLAVTSAATTFASATGATPSLDDVTLAVNGFTGTAPAITLNPAITDPCERAFTGLMAFFAANEDLMHVPADLEVRVCSYDALTDAEILRLHRGTYGGRGLSGVGNDLLAHVTRSGTLRFFAGTYLPAYERTSAMACLTPADVSATVVGEAMSYQSFSLCIPGAAHTVEIIGADTRTVGPPRLLVDERGDVRLVREVEVLLAAGRVTPEQINSDLFCCSGPTLDGCVGKILVVDEVTAEVIEQRTRCHTC